MTTRAPSSTRRWAAAKAAGIAETSSARFSGGTEASRSVSAFGEIALTAIPNRASALAAVRLNPMIPASAVA